jgi:hypothetical protein
VGMGLCLQNRQRWRRRTKKVHHKDAEGTEKREHPGCRLERRIEFGKVNLREVDLRERKGVGTSAGARLLVGCRVLDLIPFVEIVSRHVPYCSAGDPWVQGEPV